jgi:hypothetical protein
MDTPLPSIASIRARLSSLGYADVKQLATDSKVPFTTLWKIRAGTTTNPGIETVRLFIGHLPVMRKKKSSAKQTA